MVPTRKERDVMCSQSIISSQFAESRRHIEHDLLGPAIDCKCAHIAIDSVHGLSLDIARAAKDLARLSRHKLEHFGGVHFKQGDLPGNLRVLLSERVFLQSVREAL